MWDMRLLEKQVFIESQQMWLLDEDVDPRKALQPQNFLMSRAGSGEGAIGAEGNPWRQMTRRELFLQSDFRRMCVLSGAGIEKSTALAWVETHFQQAHPDCLAILLTMSGAPPVRGLRRNPGLPDDPRGYLAPWKRHGESDRPPVLLEAIRQHPTGQVLEQDDELLLAELHRLISRGQLLLIIDGLDHAWSPPDDHSDRIDSRIDALRLFLQGEGANCRVLVSGRLSVIEDQCWGALFDTDRHPWRFARIGEFDSEQAELYVGSDKWQHLQSLDADVNHSPRALEAVKRLSTAQLRQIRTASDLYWLVVLQMCGKALESGRAKAAGFKLEDLLFLYSLIAFESFCAGYTDGVDRDSSRAFLIDIWNHQHDVIFSEEQCGTDGNRRGFLQRIRALVQVNEFTEHGAFHESHQLDLIFRNRTSAEFFCALWLSHWASISDYERFVDELLTDNITADFSCYTPLVFLASMPERLADEPVAARRSHVWLHFCHRLLEQGNQRPRNTALIYHCWPTLLHLAGCLKGLQISGPRLPTASVVFRAGVPHFDEDSHDDVSGLDIFNPWSRRVVRTPAVAFEKLIELATTKLQHEVREFIISGSPSEDVADGSPARSMLYRFLGEYWMIHERRNQDVGCGVDACQSDHSTDEITSSSADRPGEALLDARLTPVGARGIARAFEMGFRWNDTFQHRHRDASMDERMKERTAKKWIPPSESDSLEFWMGNADSEFEDEQLHISYLERRFQLHDSPVTNQLLSLFDATHRSQNLSFSSHANGPAGSLSWYDAWCLSVWLGGRLPDEQEWEFACRAQPGVEMPAQAYWWGDSEALVEAHVWYETAEQLEALEVGQLEHWNGFGLCDMLGLVAEWTSTRFLPSGSIARESGPSFRRVLRGGGFYSDAEDLRTGSRAWAFTDEYPSDDYGCRIARSEPLDL